MLSVVEARARILALMQPVGTETVPLAQAHGRVTAETLTTRRTQPPQDMSAMDGYAVRAADLLPSPARLAVIAEVPAGASYDSALNAGECVRIFTGAPLPAGADAIVIQEDVEANPEAGTVLVPEAVKAGTYVRPAGLDFAEGDALIDAGTVLSARHIGLAAAMDRPWITVRRKPRVAILSTGDEVALPGDPIGPNQIVSSNGPALAAAVSAMGAVPTLLPIAPDDPEALRRIARDATGHDLLLTTGGASVGDHDLVGSALEDVGLTLDFWRIAMRPGKPLMCGTMAGVPMLGLPGNPVSTLVCFLLFGIPALKALMGLPNPEPVFETALLAQDLKENDRREDYLRGEITGDSGGNLVVSAFGKQDSSMMSRLAHADCLIRRMPHAVPAKAGEAVDILRFPSSIGGL